MSSGEFVGNDTEIRPTRRTAVRPPKVDDLDGRAKLIRELEAHRAEASDELAELDRELQDAVRESEALHEVHRRRDRLTSMYNARRDHLRELEGKLVRQVESLTPACITAAIGTIKASLPHRDLAGRERAERAISRLQKLVMVSGDPKADVKAILSDLAAQDINAL